MVMSTLPSPSVSNWKRSALPSPSVSVAHRSALPSWLVSPTIRSWRSSPRVSTCSSLMRTPHAGSVPGFTVGPFRCQGEREPAESNSMTDRFVVIGAGTMGIGIAYVAAGAGYRVDLVEVDPERAAAARDTLAGLWRKAVARDLLDAAEADEAAARIGFAATVPAGADVVVEAVPEKLELKRAVLAAAAATRPGLLASNTSSIPISALGDGVIGLHFFNPVWAMPLLEIVVGASTPPD